MHLLRNKKPEFKDNLLTSGVDVSESYKYLSEDEDEDEDFYNQEEHSGNVSPTVANFSDLTFIRDGARKLDHWDKENQSIISKDNFYQSKERVKETGSPVSRKTKQVNHLNVDPHKDALFADSNVENNSQTSEIIHSTPLIHSNSEAIVTNTLKPKNKVELESIKETDLSFLIPEDYNPKIDDATRKRNLPLSSKVVNEKKGHGESIKSLSGLALKEPSAYAKNNVFMEKPVVISDDNTISTELLSLEVELLKKKLIEKENLLIKKKKQSQKDIKKDSPNFIKLDLKSISPETVPSLGVVNHITNKTVYESYELNIIDEASESELANTLKNICLKLKTPYTKLPSTIVNLPNLVKSEMHLLKFANNVHQKLFSTDIEIPILGLNSVLFVDTRVGYKGVTDDAIRRSRINFLQSLNEMEKKIDLLKAYINEIE